MGRINGLIAILSVLAAVAPSASAQHRVTLTNREETLGKIPFNAGVAGSLVVSADGKYGAYIQPEGYTFRVVLNGEPGPAFEEIGRDSLVFSPNGTWLAYAAKEDGRWYVVEGDQRSLPYDHIVGPSLRVSADGLHFAFIATRDKQTHVVVDGVERPAVESVVDNRLVFSPVGGRLAYAAKRGGRTLVVLDGNESLLVDEASRPIFSGDGSRLVYVARTGAEAFVVLDNTDRRAARPGIRETSLALSHDGKRFAYAAQSPEGTRVIIADDAGEPHEWVFDNSITFSPDGRRLAYAVRKGGKCLIVVDGKPGTTLSDGIAPGSITFSPDGRRVAYVAELVSAGRVSRVVVVDGVVHGSTFDRIRGVPRFSPDGRHVAYIGERIEAGVSQFVVVDGTPGKAYRCIRGEPVFSPDGTRVAVMALSDDDRFEAGEEIPRLVSSDADAARRLVLDRVPAVRRSGERAQHPIEVLLVQESIAQD
jgi:Tol biopolymer transport system component